MKRIAAAAALLLAVGLTGCTDDAMEEYNDAPRGAVDTAEATVHAFPDGFGNIASKCDGPNRLYSSRITGEGRSIAVAPDDPRCTRGTP